jgi:uncharacterized membrane protein YphA (DoxX/SURF4 family)
MLLVFIRAIAGGTLLWAGWVKIPEPILFAQTVRAYNVLPLFLVNSYAIVVPWIEVVTGICLILGFWTRSSALVSFLLLFSFGVALGVNLYRGADLSCGCFSLDGTGGSLQEAMVRDVFLILGSISLFLARGIPFSIDHLWNRHKNMRLHVLRPEYMAGLHEHKA